MSFIEDLIKIKYINEGYLPNYPYHLISDEELYNAFLQTTVRFVGDNKTTEFEITLGCESIIAVYIDGLALTNTDEQFWSYEHVTDPERHLLKFSGLVPPRGSKIEVITSNRIDNYDYFHINYPLTAEIEQAGLADVYSMLESAIRDTLIKKIDDTPQNSEEAYQIPDWVYSYMFGEVIGPSSNAIDIHDMLILLGKDNLDDIISADAYESVLAISQAWLAKTESTNERPATMFGEPHVLKSLRLMNEI